MYIGIGVVVFAVLVVVSLLCLSRLKKNTPWLQGETRLNSCLLEEIRQDYENDILTETKSTLGDALDVLQGYSTTECANDIVLMNAEYRVKKCCFRTNDLDDFQRHNMRLRPEAGDAVCRVLDEVVRKHSPDYYQSNILTEVFLLRTDMIDGNKLSARYQVRRIRCLRFFRECLQRLEALEIS